MHHTLYNKIKSELKTNPTWYFELSKLMDSVKNRSKKDIKKFRTEIKKAVKEALVNGDIILGSDGYNWDQWRLPIDTIVIHHSSSSPTISLNEISATHLISLYIDQFTTDEDVKGSKMFSGHYWLDKPKTQHNMTFASYHYLIRPSGKVTQLVDESCYLWHAGNLDINRRSIAVCFAGKFLDTKEPTVKAIEAFKTLHKNKLNYIPKERVFGHNEVINTKLVGNTLCPGDSFIKIWKRKIL